MINRMSILATSMVVFKNNDRVVIANKNKPRKVEPVEGKNDNDLMRKKPHQDPYIYYKDMTKNNDYQTGKHFDVKI